MNAYHFCFAAYGLACSAQDGIELPISVPDATYMRPTHGSAFPLCLPTKSSEDGANPKVFLPPPTLVQG